MSTILVYNKDANRMTYGNSKHLARIVLEGRYPVLNSSDLIRWLNYNHLKISDVEWKYEYQTKIKDIVDDLGDKDTYEFKCVYASIKEEDDNKNNENNENDENNENNENTKDEDLEKLRLIPISQVVNPQSLSKLQEMKIYNAADFVCAPKEDLLKVKHITENSYDKYVQKAHKLMKEAEDA